MVQLVLTITGYSSWSVPSDWNSSNNKIECIASGGSPGASTGAYAGGGGGGYSKSINITCTPGGTAYCLIGTGGGTNPTWFNASTNSAPSSASNGVLANYGRNGYSPGYGGAGGSTSGAIGNTLYYGGNGADYGAAQMGAGGGAAGPNGNGSNGGRGTPYGTGGNSDGGAATGGYGGPGSSDNCFGSGYGSGGGGGSSSSYGNGPWNGGLYGGGGGGGTYAVGSGVQGIIVITYVPILSSAQLSLPAFSLLGIA